MPNRILLHGGTVLDGTLRAHARRADVLIEGERIANVAPSIAARDAAQVNATGLIVAPGFIDAHSHSDLSVLQDPVSEGRVHDGVTTEVNGTCGASLFPLAGRIADEKRASLRRHGLRADWSTAAEYFEQVDASGSTINRAFLVGHGQLRGAVMGYDAAPAGKRQLGEMQRLLAESLEQGAAGLSSGLCYPPGCFARTAEVAELCKTIAPTGRPYCTHIRNEGRGLLRSIHEAIAIARGGGVPLHISHVKTFGRSNWWKIDKLERTLLDMRKGGMDLTADRYPYTAAMTDLSTIFPDRLMEGGRTQALARLRDAKALAALRAEIGRTRRKLLWDQIMIATASGSAQEFQGLTVEQSAERLGMPPFEAVVELLLRAELGVTAIFFEMSEENLERILAWPFVYIGSDSSARSLTGPTAKGRPHPRSFCSSARFLCEYVARKKCVSLAEGIAKLTSLPAERFALKDRGVIRPGAYADIVAFDLESLRDTATYAEPLCVSEGVRHVMVNGKVILQDGRLTGKRPGRVLRA